MQHATDIANRPARFHFLGTVHANGFYVERSADRELPQSLLHGDYCYVLGPRQIGKSSLRLRAEKRLRDAGVECATIDLTSIGDSRSAADEWYYGLAYAIAEQLHCSDAMDLFFRGHDRLPPVQRWTRALREVVLEKVGGPISIFLDEIDAVRGLSFGGDDFLAATRALYNARADDYAYQRLTFCLLGVAAPGDLMRDEARTPFNVGRSIRLADFTREECEAFLPGLVPLGGDPTAWLDAAYAWTDGHPYMTQKLCAHLLQNAAVPPAGGEAARVDTAVEELFLRRGRVEDPNLAYAERHVSRDNWSARSSQMLQLYRSLLDGKQVHASRQNPTQLALQLTGLAAERVVDRGRVLRVRNRIFGTVFGPPWVEEQLASRPLADALSRWLKSGRQEDYLLRGRALDDALSWANGNDDVTAEENEFLIAGLGLVNRERSLRSRRTVGVVAALGAAIIVLAAAMLYAAGEARDTRIANARLNATLAQMRQADELALAQRPGQELRHLALRLEALADAVGAHRQSDASSAVPPSVFAGLSSAVAAAQRSVPLVGHGAAVMAVAFSPDGARVVTGARDGTARIWRSDDGAPLFVLDSRVTDRAHASSAEVGAVAFSPNGTLVATGDADGVARLWDVTSGGLARDLVGHGDRIRTVEFSHDGGLLLTASDDDTVRLWDVARGQERGRYQRDHDVLSAAFSSDDQLIVTAEWDRVVRVLRADSGDVVFAFTGHTDRVTSAVFSPNGRIVASASADRTLRLWDLETAHGTIIDWPLGGMRSVRYSPDGRALVTGGRGVIVWDLDARRPIEPLSRDYESVESAVFSADGRHVASAGDDGLARVFAWPYEQAAVILEAHATERSRAASSPDGARVVVASDDGTATVWDVSGGPPRLTLRHPGEVTDAVFAPGGTRIATSCVDGRLRLWDPASGQLLAILVGGSRPLEGVSFSPDGERVIAGDTDAVARVWSVRGGTPLMIEHDLGERRLRVIPARGFRAVFSPDGTLVLTAGSGRFARQWDARSGAPVGPQLAQGGEVATAAFSPDGARIVTAGSDGATVIWSARTGQSLRRMAVLSVPLNDARFSPDGRLIATAGSDGRVRLFDGSGAAVRVMTTTAGTEGVRSVSFAPDGRRLASLASRRIQLWDVATGMALATYEVSADEWYDPRGGIAAMTFTPDGRYVLASGRDGRARLFPATVDGLLPYACRMLRHHGDLLTPALMALCGAYLNGP